MPDPDAPQDYLGIQIILIILTKQVNLFNTPYDDIKKATFNFSALSGIKKKLPLDDHPLEYFYSIKEMALDRDV